MVVELLSASADRAGAGDGESWQLSDALIEQVAPRGATWRRRVARCNGCMSQCCHVACFDPRRAVVLRALSASGCARAHAGVWGWLRLVAFVCVFRSRVFAHQRLNRFRLL